MGASGNGASAPPRLRPTNEKNPGAPLAGNNGAKNNQAFARSLLTSTILAESRN